jgi:hypothetical protein
MSYSLYRKLGK